MSKAAFWQRGETIDYKNAGETKIEANSVLVIGSRIGIAGMSIEPNEVGSVHVSGVFEFEKTADQQITLGAEVYFNATTGKITTTSSSATKAGFAVEAATAAATKVLVKINA